MNCIQISYKHNTIDSKYGDVTADGEPNYLEFDITLVKDNDGSHTNPSNLRLNIELTYGDAMVSEFIIKMPGEVEVIHYTGINSKYDKETEFGFEDNSLKNLIEFFNRFGFKLDKKDFTFIDKYRDSYTFKESLRYIKNYKTFKK
jgi:hypothetical protein